MIYKESQIVELKSSLSDWHDIVISLAAFANTQGGTVVIGLDDKGNPTDLKIGARTLEDLAQKIKQNTDPVLYTSFSVKTYGPYEIMEVEVKESDFKPVFAFNKSYLRVGKSNQKLSSQKIRELALKYQLPETDLSPIPVKGITWDNKLVAQKTKFKYALASQPDFGLGQMVKAARFQGTKRVEFLDEQKFSGNMIRAIDWMIAFVKKHTNKALVFDGEPQHKEFWQYPIPALREAMINALIHRDLNDNCAVFLEIYDDRLEIANPGFLPKEIKEGSIFSNIRSVARNKGLAKVFSSLKLIEAWGTGFKRIHEYCEATAIKIRKLSKSPARFDWCSVREKV